MELYTILFYGTLTLWGLFIAYLAVVPKFVVSQKEGVDDVLNGDEALDSYTDSSVSVSTNTPNTAVVAKADTAPAVNAARAAAPMNLPVVGVAPAPAASTMPAPAIDVVLETEELDEVSPKEVDGVFDEAFATQIENRAHEHKVLLSSDAIRAFLHHSNDELDQLVYLERVIAEAKTTFPDEDGWLVLNQARMDELCVECSAAEKQAARKTPAVSEAADAVSAVESEVVTVSAPAFEAMETAVEAASLAPTVPSTPIGASSLAEAMVVGNREAAYQLLGSNPTFAVIDAITDFDALYRIRQGEGAFVSDMLQEASEKITDQTLKDTVIAMSKSTDGTYTDEEAAAKLAIMQGMKVLQVG